MEAKKIDSNTNFKPPQPLKYTIRDLSYTVQLKDKTNFPIIHPFDAEFLPGEVTGILGPVGAGKTSTLSLLGKRKSGQGSIKLNNFPLKKTHKKLMGYVLQKDFFFSELSVFDSLILTADLRRGDLSKTQKQNLVDEIIQLLRLTNARNTRIGDPFNHGVSGGELKRVNIGTELISNPSICLLDEPTSGLDSSSAITILETLGQLARNFSVNVVLSIHQPSSQAFALLDKVIILAEGHVLFQGRSEQLIHYLEFIGYKTPLGWNVSDYVMELVSDPIILQDMKKFYNKYITKDSNGTTYMNYLNSPIPAYLMDKPEEPESYAVKIADQNDKSVALITSENSEDVDNKDLSEYNALDGPPPKIDTNSSLSELVIESTPANHIKLVNFKHPSWLFTTYTLLKRGLKKDSKGETPFYTFAQTIILAFICGAIWFRNLSTYTEETLVDRSGFLFFGLTYWLFLPSFIALISFINERVTISKERSSKSFKISSYLFAKTVSDLAIYSLTPTIFVIIVFPLVGIQFTAAQLFGLWGCYMITMFVSHSVGMAIASMFTRFESSSLVLTIFSLVCMLTGGFFVSYESVPAWLGWIRYISLLNYSMSILIYTNYHGQFFECAENTRFPTCPMPGDELMKGFTTGFGPGLDLLCLLAILVITKFMTYLFLRFGNQLKMK